MARKSLIARHKKRLDLVNRYRQERARVKEVLRAPGSSDEERRRASRTLHSMPRDACPARLRNRCEFTGRPRGVYRKFGICRNKLRECAMRGEVPGLGKASW